MGLFRRECEYCGKKIEKEQEVFRDVKNPVFVGTKQKAFCCNEHANSYEREVEEYLKKPKGGKSCCG